MITISLMGQLQTADGERDLACEVPSPMSVRRVIQRQGVQLRHLLQLIREKKVLVTINKKIASEDSLVQDGDAIRLVGHDGMGEHYRWRPARSQRAQCPACHDCR